MSAVAVSTLHLASTKRLGGPEGILDVWRLNVKRHYWPEGILDKGLDVRGTTGLRAYIRRVRLDVERHWPGGILDVWDWTSRGTGLEAY